MSIPFTYIKEPAKAEQLCRRLMGETAVGLDYEATGLDPRKNQITLAAFADRKQNTWVVDTREKKMLQIFKPLLENDKIVKLAHNAPYEYAMAKGAGIDTENMVCTLLGERSMTAGVQFSGYGLGEVVKKYLNIDMDKDLQKSFIDYMGEFSKDQLEYSAFDAHVMFPLAGKMKAEAKRLGVLETWLDTECVAIQAFGDIEFYGQKLDVDAWRANMTTNAIYAQEAKVVLDQWFEPVCSKVFNLEPGMEGTFSVDINYNSVPQVLYALQMMGLKVDGETIENTNKKTQQKIKEHPAVRALTKYRSAVKLTGTYGETYIARIDPETGRIHFRFNQYGTDTGRPACRGKLNCLNIPREKRYRNAFGTDDDRLISTVDYSAAELRILAELSGDRLMIDGFNSGVDFHCYVASMLFGVEVTKKNENAHRRDPAKTLNFGIAYGMSPFSLYEKLHYEMGMAITLAECEDLFKRYGRTFQVAIGWLKSQQRLASTVYQMSNMNGRLRRWSQPNMHKIKANVIAELTKKGRLALTPEMEELVPELMDEKLKGQRAAVQREGANCQIQSVNADFTKRSMAVIRKEFKRRGFDSRMYNSVYDEIVMDSHKSCAEEAHELQKKIMVDEANKMLKLVPMQVEGHLAARWTK